MFRRLWVKVLLTVLLVAVLRVAIFIAMGPPGRSTDHSTGSGTSDVPRMPLRLLLLPLAIEVGSTILIAVLVAFPLVRRIRRLAVETRAVLDSDLDGTVLEGADELGELGRAFNEASRAARARLDAERQRDERIRTALVDLAHDVRTPLAAIKLGIDRLVAEPGSEVATIALRANVDHVDRLFSNVASAIQLGGSTIPLHVRAVDVGEVARRVVERFRLVAEGRQVTLHVHWPEAPLTSGVDPIAFEQAVGNLVDNAVKFARENVAVLAFERGGAAVVQVRDDGPGFAADEAASLVER
ncbi:HAMP domain-containing histidine kinase, partial [Candidatus Binatia bacterium]|nr:HAMP domain-containing histidine kinase [Candidatus Binatia bacterium]